MSRTLTTAFRDGSAPGGHTPRNQNTGGRRQPQPKDTKMNFLQSIRAGMRKRRTEHSLRELDDHLLRDIGLSRHEVDIMGRNRSTLRTFRF